MTLVKVKCSILSNLTCHSCLCFLIYLYVTECCTWNTILECVVFNCIFSIVDNMAGLDFTNNNSSFIYIIDMKCKTEKTSSSLWRRIDPKIFLKWFTNRRHMVPKAMPEGFFWKIQVLLRGVNFYWCFWDLEFWKYNIGLLQKILSPKYPYFGLRIFS